MIVLCFSAQEALLSLHGPAEVDRQKTLWGLCWLLHAVNLDYPELGSFIIRNIRDRRPLAPDEGQPWEDGEAAASPKMKGKRETITLCLQLDS